jgi:hypothetical protein
MRLFHFILLLTIFSSLISAGTKPTDEAVKPQTRGFFKNVLQGFGFGAGAGVGLAGGNAFFNWLFNRPKNDEKPTTVVVQQPIVETIIQKHQQTPAPIAGEVVRLNE